MSQPLSPRRRQFNPVIEMLEVRRMLSADLTGLFSSSIPAALQSGDRNHLAIEVVNEGDVSATGKVTVNLFASSDPSGGDDNVLLGSVSRQINLKPDHGSKINFHFAEPPTLPDGTYSLIASIDSSAVANTTTTHDIIVARSRVSVQRPGSDLTAEMVVAPTQPIIITGDGVDGQAAGVKLANRGTRTAHGLVSIDFYLSTNQTLDSQDILVGSIADLAINLKPGHSETLETALEPPLGTPGGQYFLFADAVPQAGIVQKNLGDEVGLAPQQVDIIRTASAATTSAGQDAAQVYTGATVECASGGTGTVETPTPTPAAATDSTPPADSSTPTCDTSSNCDSSTPSCDDATQNCDNSQTQPDTQPDQSADDTTQPTTDDSSQLSGDNTTQPSTDSSSTDTNQPTTNNSQNDSTPPTDNSTDTSAPLPDDSSQSTDSSGDASDSSDDSSQSTDSSGDSSDSNTADSSQLTDSSSDDSSDDGYTDPGF